MFVKPVSIFPKLDSYSLLPVFVVIHPMTAFCKYFNPIQGRLKFPKIGQGGLSEPPPCTLCSI